MSQCYNNAISYSIVIALRLIAPTNLHVPPRFISSVICVNFTEDSKNWLQSRWKFPLLGSVRVRNCPTEQTSTSPI